jgi:UDPglucose--hexose-1-phosphate uridylyltransferase
MSELRTDWLTGRSVLVAENRALRPNEFSVVDDDIAAADVWSTESSLRTLSTCPFCLGNEAQTPAAECEILDDQGNWFVRVIPNAFPAVNNLSGAATLASVEASAQPVIASMPSNEMQSEISILGVHEVIVESGLHLERMSELSLPHLRQVVETYSRRLRHWRQLPQLRYGLLFKNQGPRAGASLTHIHSQFVALPFVPDCVDAEVRRGGDYFRRHESCAYCDTIESERAAKLRLVTEQDGYFVFCPFASLQPHEVWLTPTEHAASFEFESPDSLNRLTGVLHRLLAQFEVATPHAQYNLVLRTAPWDGDNTLTYHWRIELLPRVNSFAGLEVATGTHINPLAPERSASQLRATGVF